MSGVQLGIKVGPKFSPKNSRLKFVFPMVVVCIETGWSGINTLLDLDTMNVVMWCLVHRIFRAKWTCAKISMDAKLFSLESIY